MRAASPLPVLATLAGALIIALAPILVRLSELGPQATAFWRLALGALTLFILTPLRREPPPPRRLWPLMLLAGACFAFDLACWHAAIRLTTVANATLLANLTPVVVGLGAWVVLGERPGRIWSIAAAAGMAGAALLGFSRTAGGAGAALGDMLALATTFWYAGYLLLIRSVRQGADVWWVMLVSSSAGALAALAVALVAREPLLPGGLREWAILAALGCIVHVCGQGAIAFGLGRLPAAVTSVLILVQPVASAALGWVLFREAVAPLGLVGAALVLAGAWGAQQQAGKASVQTGSGVACNGAARDEASPPTVRDRPK